jgi:protein-tyrosine phosphatase
MRYEHAHEIVQGIFLGNKEAAHDENFLRRHKIQLIVNCTKDVPFQEHFRTIEHYRVPIDDKLAHEDSAKLLRLLPLILERIMKMHYAGKNVLVHCFAGMQRSAAVVAGLLIFVHGMSADQAVKYIRSIRPIAFTPGVNFMYTLKKFEQEVHNL